MKTVTLKLVDKKYNDIKKYYAPYLKVKKDEKVDFFAKVETVTITGYINKKKEKSVVFSGAKAEDEASKWVKNATNKKIADDGHEPKKKVATKKVEIKKSTAKKTTTKKVEAKKDTPKREEKPTKTTNRWVDYNDQIGSDEVGTGDFLGPMIVVACYVKKEDIKFLNELGVKDSKKISDAKIREIGPILAKRLEFSKLTCSNEKYNEMIITHENINSLKAKLHNRALLNLVDKHPDVIGVYIDQFVSKEKYFEYLNNPEERQVKDVAFRTKGESLFPCVAAASIIARYAFLQEIDLLNNTYDVEIPLGAGAKVNEFSKEFIKTFGIKEFNKIAKRNFANYKEVIMMN